MTPTQRKAAERARTVAMMQNLTAGIGWLQELMERGTVIDDDWPRYTSLNANLRDFLSSWEEFYTTGQIVDPPGELH